LNYSSEILDNIQVLQLRQTQFRLEPEANHQVSLSAIMIQHSYFAMYTQRYVWDRITDIGTMGPAYHSSPPIILHIFLVRDSLPSLRTREIKSLFAIQTFGTAVLAFIAIVSVTIPAPLAAVQVLTHDLGR